MDAFPDVTVFPHPELDQFPERRGLGVSAVDHSQGGPLGEPGHRSAGRAVLLENTGSQGALDSFHLRGGLGRQAWKDTRSMQKDTTARS